MIYGEEVISQRKMLDNPESSVHEPIRFCVNFGQRVIIAWVPQQSHWYLQCLQGSVVFNALLAGNTLVIFPQHQKYWGFYLADMFYG